MPHPLRDPRTVESARADAAAIMERHDPNTAVRILRRLAELSNRQDLCDVYSEWADKANCAATIRNQN